jgi:hypothetical protein
MRFEVPAGMQTRTLPLVVLLGLAPQVAHAADAFTVVLQVGPVAGAATESRSLTFEQGTRRSTRTFDVQDGREHIVRGLSLRELVAQAHAPRTVDAAVFWFADGMQIPVRLSDKEDVDAIFIALEHGDVRERFETVYPLSGKEPLPCPKVVYGRKATTYTIWLYPTQLSKVQLVTWKAYEAALAQPTRNRPDRSGWPIYLKNCQPCHGIGGQGATRGPDFLSNMDAYRRVPPLATTDLSEHPSLHEKVKGFAPGTMPVLNHVPNADVATLWRWLHAIHRGGTK